MFFASFGTASGMRPVACWAVETLLEEANREFDVLFGASALVGPVCCIVGLFIGA